VSFFLLDDWIFLIVVPALKNVSCRFRCYLFVQYCYEAKVLLGNNKEVIKQRDLDKCLA